MENRPYRHPKFTMWITLIIAGIILVTILGYRLFFEDTDHGLAVVALVSPTPAAAEGPEPAIIEAAVELALADWSVEHGPAPVDVRPLMYANFPGEVFEELRSLQRVARLTAVVGDTTPETTTILANLAQELRVPHLVPFTPAGDWLVEYPFSFALQPPRTQGVQELADWIAEQTAAREIAVISDDLMGPSIAGDLAAFLPAGSLVYRLDPDPDAPDDWSSVLAELGVAEDLDAVVLDLPLNEAGAVVQVLQAMELDTVVVAAPLAAVDEDVLADPDLAGVWTLLPWYSLQALDETTPQHHFQTRLQESLGADDGDELGRAVYDAVTVLLMIMSEVGTDPGSMRAALAVYDGDHLGGWMSFDDVGMLTDSSLRWRQLGDGSLQPMAD